MTDPDDPVPQAPDPITVAPTTAQLRATHREEGGILQHALNRLTATIATPGFVALLCVSILLWIGFNLEAKRLGFDPVDPPPFAWLQTASSVGALVIAGLILSTQRHEDKLADHRAHLTLELSVNNDLKVAKIIELLEESRRDNPAIADRVDPQAEAMATPSDSGAVLEAIKDLHDDIT